MWPAVMAFARAYAPWIVFPAAVTVGFIGFNLEGLVSDRYTPWKKSAIERREERRLQELEGNENTFEVPKTIFEKNVSPSLKKKE